VSNYLGFKPAFIDNFLCDINLIPDKAHEAPDNSALKCNVCLQPSWGSICIQESAPASVDQPVYVTTDFFEHSFNYYYSSSYVFTLTGAVTGGNWTFSYVTPVTYDPCSNTGIGTVGIFLVFPLHAGVPTGCVGIDMWDNSRTHYATVHSGSPPACSISPRPLRGSWEWETITHFQGNGMIYGHNFFSCFDTPAFHCVHEGGSGGNDPTEENYFINGRW